MTLDKAEGYHDRISYHDYAISPELFHWQTQNNAGPDTPAGRRYIESPWARPPWWLECRRTCPVPRAVAPRVGWIPGPLISSLP